MRDILYEAYEIIKDDSDVRQYFNHIYFYEYPEPNEMTVPYIVMSELDDTLPFEYADNDNLALSYLISVDVFVPLSNKYDGYSVCKDTSYHITRILKDKLGLENTANSQPEYDSDYKLYRRVRNFSGTYYRSEI